MRISNKAIVGVAGVLCILGAVAVTKVSDCLWALLLMPWILDSVQN